MPEYRVVEKFISINGEGQRAGELAVFIRLAGCNMRCSYCDTLWALEKDVPFVSKTDEEIVDYLLNKYNDLELIKMEKNYPFNSLGEGQFYSIIKKAGEDDYKTIAPKMTDLSGINVIRYGVHEYEKKNDLMKPTHESTHVDDIRFNNVVDLDDIEINKYLKGEVIKKDLSFKGYCKVTYKNMGMGLAKYANGVLKNHYPKGLRLL